MTFANRSAGKMRMPWNKKVAFRLPDITKINLGMNQNNPRKVLANRPGKSSQIAIHKSRISRLISPAITP